MTIYLPSSGPQDWQALLADPEKHWRTGYSAKTLAHSWAAADGLPQEVDAVLGGDTELLFATPEHKVPMPGRGRDSQSDIFALVRRGDEIIALTVEGKVNESFGDPISQWLSKAEGDGSNRCTRLAAITEMLDRPFPPGELYYQLFHRSASAIVEARRFKADRAAMIVHSFSPNDMWFDAFAAFAAYLGVQAAIGEPVTIIAAGGLPLTIGWAKGQSSFLAA